VSQFLKVSRAEFYFLVEEEEMVGFERLRSKEAMLEYYAPGNESVETLAAEPEKNFSNYSNSKIDKIQNTFGRSFPKFINFEHKNA
jgi:hypothetical protein